MNEKHLPTLKPGDSHMKSLIEAAIQGHADTREAMRWLVRQLVPSTPPAEVTDKQIHAVFKDAGQLLDPPPYHWVESFARAILALRPVQVPMTDEQIDKLQWGPSEGNPMTFAEGLREFARAVEAHHGIKTHD